MSIIDEKGGRLRGCAIKGIISSLTPCVPFDDPGGARLDTKRHIFGCPLAPTTTSRTWQHLNVSVSVPMAMLQRLTSFPLPIHSTHRQRSNPALIIIIMRSFLAGVLLLMLPFLALGFVPRLPSKGLATKVSARGGAARLREGRNEKQ